MFLEETTVATTTIQTRTEETTSVKQQITSTEQQIISTEEKLSTMISTAIVTTSKSFIYNRSCRPPDITLIPGKSSLLSPIQFRRSQNFYIISIIQLNCNESISITTKWTISNCTSICSNQTQIDPTISTAFSELYIPARILPYGIYKLKLTVTMVDLPSLISSSSVYVRITPSGITVNLVQLGTSMITSGHEQDLKLDPGTYSVDPDRNIFNASNWKYEYYCRIYGIYMFPNIHESLLPIDDPRIDPNNPSCLLNHTGNGSAWKYNDVSLSPKSSLAILAGSLQSNRTYQFMVYMKNLRNASLQATGYVLVRIEDTRPQMIAIGCVILTMCIPNLEYQLVNPTTQVPLFALCIENCTTIQNIKWNIYQGTINSSSNLTQWTLFNQMITYENIWFFGTNTSHFTASNQLFLANPKIIYWRFEVVYTFVSETSSSALNFVLNQPPYNGSCTIHPLIGTTSTLFDISCADWFDKDDIKDYSVYVWASDSSERMIIAYSPVSTFQVRLPAGNDLTSSLHIIVHIRDTLDCITKFNITSVNVLPDSARISNLINSLQSSSNSLTSNPIVQLLASQNQNIVGQVITSLSQELNKMNSENIDKAVSNGIPAASISISPLGSKRSQKISIPLNITALNEYNKDLNSHTNVREYLMKFITALAITISDSIKLQSSSIAQLTKATNQLTRTTLTMALDRCYQLSVALHSMSTRISYEDVQTAATQLIQCTTNLLSAVNGPLQQRTNILDLDLSRATTFSDDYDTDLEFEWSNPNLFADGNDFSWETIQKNQNIYYQKQLSNKIENQANKIISLLTSSLNIHINIGQDLIMNTPEVFMSLETISMNSLSNKRIKQVGNAQIQLPRYFNSTIHNNSTISLRSKMEPLAPFGNSKSSSDTNLSRSISLSILDENQNEISIQTNLLHPIEIIIPRDPNLIIEPMILQNVTSTNSTNPHNQLFYLHYINITTTLPISVHFEIRPLNISLAYLFIYKFDQLPLLSSSIHQIDGWTLFCPLNLTNERIYTYFIDNQKTSGHQSIIFSLRELNSTEIMDFCSNLSMTDPPIRDERFNFTSNYELRIYASGCYYLDRNNQWQSDGLIVGPLTNHRETQCFSTHLTTFAGGFMILPLPTNWNYVFTKADLIRNKTIYLIVICISIIYFLLIIYLRYKDTNYLEKLGVTPLLDKHKSDQYFYQIVVFIGQLKDAETKSKIHFVLFGDSNQTPIRTISDSHRKILQRGEINGFLMAIPKSLGSLNCIRIRHDNTGKGSSSSFLKYLIIRDLQTMEKFHFICQRWLAVEKDDGKIERVLPVCTARKNINADNQEIYSFMLTKFQHSIGWKKPTDEEVQEGRDTLMHSLYLDRIELFRQKIDPLLDVLNLLYMTHKSERIRMQKTAV